MKAHSGDERTIERWRVEPRWHPLDKADEPELVEPAPPLWADLAVAAIAAALLWGAAVALFG